MAEGKAEILGGCQHSRAAERLPYDAGVMARFASGDMTAGDIRLLSDD